MSAATERTAGTSRSIGPVVMLVGLLAILLSRGISRHRLGDNHDPGPRAFPVGLGVCLILGGALQTAYSGRHRKQRSAPTATAGESVERNDSISRPAGLEPSLDSQARPGFFGRINFDVLILLAALALYIPAISWLGFSLSTLLFSLGLMRRLGTGWLLAGLMSLALVVAIHLLFVTLFKVQLPTGVWGMPF
jgi:Tripartite tricarboxylate transporter TctB family